MQRLNQKEKWGSVVLLIERELETADSAEDCERLCFLLLLAV